ncbi:hypothetical protein ABE218_06355 [Bacillus smithii]|jgi:hypothetical protein|uniref:hypothetical protein n=1 Tax=Bacillus smithii TaxID=1479 RepID=UPI003D1A3C70
MRFFLMAAVVFLLLNGCGMIERDSTYGEREDRHGVQFVSHRDRLGNQERRERDDPTNTNQNPNFIDRAPDQPNLGTDIEKAKQVIRNDTNHYEADSVWINGRTMWVKVNTHRKLSDEDKAEARLHRKLIQALPRYRIEVDIKQR